LDWVNLEGVILAIDLRVNEINRKLGCAYAIEKINILQEGIMCWSFGLIAA